MGKYTPDIKAAYYGNTPKGKSAFVIVKVRCPRCGPHTDAYFKKTWVKGPCCRKCSDILKKKEYSILGKVTCVSLKEAMYRWNALINC